MVMMLMLPTIKIMMLVIQTRVVMMLILLKTSIIHSILIYLIQEHGMHLILKQLIYCCKRVLKGTCLLSMVLETNFLEGFLHYHTLELSQMETSMTENGLYTVKNLTKYFVSVANY